MSDHDDSEHFRKAMQGVRRLRGDRLWLREKPPGPVPRQTQADEAQALADTLSDQWEPDIHTGEQIEFYRPGLQKGLVRQLRRGQFAVEAELDLHGMRVAEARQALLTAMGRWQVQRLRVVRIIHGKGHGSPGKQPVLKRKLDRWLRQMEAVLAYTTARPEHGGAGAIYLLLKRGQHER